MQLFLALASVVCAVVPMLGFLAAVWWLDRYDREPVWLLGLTFLWGAVPSVVLAVVFSAMAMITVASAFGVAGSTVGADLMWLADATTPVLIAPLVEEPSKALILLAIIYTRHFDNMTDGFVYGAAAGLGFGMTENLLYFLGATTDLGMWWGTVVIRTFYSAVMHATASAIVGAALGWGRFRGPVWLGLTGLVGIVLAMAVHGLWNGLITVDQVAGTQGAGFGINLLLFPMEFAFTFVVFQVCLVDESLTLRRELREEADAGHIPEHHPGILSSWIRRLGRSWLPDGVDHHHYVQTATELAMRKRQQRLLGPRAPAYYDREIVRLRRELVSQIRPPRRSSQA